MQSLVEFIVDDKQAFCVVEKPSFRAFVKSLNKFYEVPHRRTLVRSIRDQYQEALGRLKVVLDDIPGKVALTADGWSSRVMRGYFVLTIHWVDKSWNLRSCVLEFKYFPPPHDTHSTCQLVYDVLRDFNLHTRVAAITTDSGSEMISAMRLLRIMLQTEFSVRIDEGWHIRCICHVMNRAAVDARSFIQSNVEKIRSLLKAVRGSMLMREEFAVIQIRLGKTSQSQVPNLDVDTRWNSMYSMVSSCYKLRDVFESLWNMDGYRTKLESFQLSDQDWRVLKSCIDFLERMDCFTKSASGSSYATLSVQTIIFDSLVKHCNRHITGRSLTG